MFCKNCQTAIRVGFNTLTSKTEKKSWLRPHITLHHSLPSFYKSIASGCVICRQIWTSIISCQETLSNIEILPHVVEGSIPETFEQFRRQIQWIESAAERSSQKKVLPSSNVLTGRLSRIVALLAQHSLQLLPAFYWAETSKKVIRITQDWRSKSALVRFHMGDLEDHVFIHVTGNTSAWECEFQFWPVLWNEDLGNPFSRLDFKIHGTSTAAMPELWRHWFRVCETSHTICCALRKKGFSPDRLIEILYHQDDKETIKWRLIERCANVPTPYLTLSHCWGAASHVKLTKRTYSVFLTGLKGSDLPKTYQHALDITASLGFRYLWIDSLCIFQDDMDDWREQSSVMGSIYGNACCNIAATWASDSDQGCFNKRDPCIVTPSTIVLNHELGFSMVYQISRGSMYDEDITNAALNSRGWVVQERCLAQKQLSFTKYQVYWECPELIASEQFPNGLPTQLWTQHDYALLQPPTGKPRLNFDHEDELRLAWCSLVEIYSTCELTRPSDKMIALAGLADELRNRTGDIYLAGLWKTDLQKQLCWRYSVWFDGSSNRSRTLCYNAPTWSWASFDGPVKMDFRYRMPELKEAYFIDILNVWVNSEGPSKLHSFVSSELQMRAIAMWGRVIPIGEDEDESFRVLFTEHAKSGIFSDVNDSIFSIYWDENLPPSRKLSEPWRWRRLQEERNSDLLFVFVAGNSGKWILEEGYCDPVVDGLILRKTHAPDGNGKFIRVAGFTLEHGDWLLDILAARLELQSDVSLIGRINLEDPRLANLVHTVNII